MTIAVFEDPIPGSRFIVTLYPSDSYIPAAQAALIPLLPQGVFQSVAGLGAELELFPYPEGGANDFVHQLPVRHSWTPITLTRGVVRDLGLYRWYEAGLNSSLGARRDGAVILMTPLGVPAVAWMFRGGLASRWTGPDLNAMEDSIAIETLEIAHEGLIQFPLSVPIPGVI